MWNEAASNAVTDDGRSPKQLRVLIVEDEPADAELLVLQLRSAGFSVTADVVNSPPAFEAAIGKRFYDVVLSDYKISGGTGRDILLGLNASGQDIPFILVTGELQDSEALDCIQHGAADYVLKHGLPRLPLAVRRALVEKGLRDAHQLSMHALSNSEKRLRHLFERSLAGVYQVTLDGHILDLNDAGARMFGYASPEEAKENSLWEITRVSPEFKAMIARLVELKVVTNLEVALRKRDGSPLRVLFNASLNDSTSPPTVEGTIIDVTERRQLEEQFYQSQKMEAVGRLAGGVAHDFNNLLTAIIGFSEMVLEKLPAASDQRRPIQEIKRAGERAAMLTKQLLAFSRQQVLTPEVLDLNSVVSEMSHLLHRVIGEDIQLVTNPEPSLGCVKADPAQLEQVLVNLAVNARDAMPNGGRLVIETCNIRVTETTLDSPIKVPPGAYTLLMVTDTGQGMDAATVERAFDPFFTTKEKGKGTGLGLATVYGIVKQSGGYISITSEPNAGTAVRIYLPQVDELAEPIHPPLPVRTPLRPGTETILVVEDNPSVRQLISRLLQDNGYVVLVAKDGKEALALAGKHAGSIDLLLTDIVLPHLSGPDLAKQLIAIRPEIRVLFMSGYPATSAGGKFSLERNAKLIQKPFKAAEFARRVRDALDDFPQVHEGVMKHATGAA